MKSLIILLENANTWISKFETRLCCQESSLVVNELTQLLSNVQRLFAELDVMNSISFTIRFNIRFKILIKFN